jgi:hypothetical protein
MSRVGVIARRVSSAAVQRTRVEAPKQSRVIAGLWIASLTLAMTAAVVV